MFDLDLLVLLHFRTVVSLVGKEYMKLGGGGIHYMEPTRGGAGENKARNETPVLGSFKFNCLVPKNNKIIPSK